MVERCEVLFDDLRFAAVQDWKSGAPEGACRKAIGYLPIHAPRDVIHAAGFLPVGLFGGGDRLDVIRADALFQSYICQLPRSFVEMGLTGRLDALDGVVFPSTCDVVRNLSGMWQVLFPDRWSRYLELPQNLGPTLGGRFYAAELRSLAVELQELGGLEVTPARLRASIALFGSHAAKVGRVFSARREQPHKVPTWELYLVMRAGYVLPVEEHDLLLDEYLADIAGRAGRARDDARVVVVGASCEQPPMGLMRTLERAGCAIVEDDLTLGMRWIRGPVTPREGEDPFTALARAYVEQSAQAAQRFHPDREAKGRDLVQTVRECDAEGVIFCSPSSCDPSLLDRPMLAAALDREGIPWMDFEYTESTGSFRALQDQAGSFSDSIRLWMQA